jgi:hypothetical protein
MVTRLVKRWQKSMEWLFGLFRVRLKAPLLKYIGVPLTHIDQYARRIAFIERREYSQNGEDGILEVLFGRIGVTNKFCVEFGAEDGVQTNTRYLVQKKGWKALLLDGRENPVESGIQQAFITAENIEELFAKYRVPEHFDLLSIDIDGNDYWVWKAITKFKPRVVVMEYNAHIPPTESRTIPYNASFVWDGTDYYGVSLLALKKLGEEKGYTLLGTDAHGVNAFFVLNQLVPGNFAPEPWPNTYHAPAFKGKTGKTHPKDTKNRPWITI